MEQLPYRSRPIWSRRSFLASVGLTGSAMAVAGLAGCGEEAEAPSAVSKAKVPPDLVKEAKAASGKNLASISQEEYFEGANRAYNEALQVFAKSTGTTIKNTGVNVDEGNLVAKQDAAVKAGNVQDLAYFDGGRFVAQFQQLDDLLPVTDAVADLEKKYGAAAPIAPITNKIEGEWWGIPFYTRGGGWFARKDWLEEKGIGEDEITTFESARDIALEITDPTKRRFGWGVTMNRSGDANGVIENCINNYGGAVRDDEGQKVTLDSPETIEAVNFLVDIYTNDKYKDMVPPGVASWTDTSNNENWLAGSIGLTSNAYSLYAESKATDNPVYDVTLPFAGLTGPASDTVINVPAVMSLVVFKNAENPELAMAVAKYLVAGDPLIGLAKESNGLVAPAYEDVWSSDKYFTEGDPIFKILRDLVTQPLPVETATGYKFPQSPSPGAQNAVASYVLTDMMADILQGKHSVAEGVKATHERIVKIFEQLGIKQ